MDLQNKYQILANEFSKARGQVTVLKKAVLDEQEKNHQLQEDNNKKDQNLRRNNQEIETLTFLNSQLKSRLELLQHELQDQNKPKKTTNNNNNTKASTFISYHDDVLAQELEQKIKEYELLHRRVYELEKQISDDENERLKNRSVIDQLQNQIAEKEKTHQSTRDNYENILKQLKEENLSLHQQIKQHLQDQQTSNSSSKNSSTTNSIQPEIFFYQYITNWKVAFTELTIYIEERLKNNHQSTDNHDKMSQVTKAFQQRAENFLTNFKKRHFEEKSSTENDNTVDFAELFSMFVASAEQVLTCTIKSISDEPTAEINSDHYQKIYEKMHQLNEIIHQLFQNWANHFSQLRETSISFIRIDPSTHLTDQQLQEKISELCQIFQKVTITHSDLDKTYNEKLCLEYELNASPGHLTTTDECILASLRKLSSLDQQIFEFIRDNQRDLFDYHQRQKLLKTKETENENLLIDFSEDTHQQLIDVHKKQILYNAETIGALEQEKEHWRLEYQLLKIKFEKMRDDHSKEIDTLKEKNFETSSTNEQFDQNHLNDQHEIHSTSESSNERELLIKQYYSQKILDLETKLQLTDGKRIAFYNELASIHQRLKHSKDQEQKARSEIDQLNRELSQMKDELGTTTKVYEEQIAAMSEHLASMNEKITSQNEKIDKLEQQHHPNQKDGKKKK